MTDKRKDSNLWNTGSHVIDIEDAQEKRRIKRERDSSDKKRRKTEKSKSVSSDNTSRRTIEDRKKKRKKIGRTRKVLIFIMVVAVLFFVGGAVAQVIKLNMELRDVEEKKAQIQIEKNKLVRDLNRINDPAYIEEQARKRLRMIRQGEILYVFPDNEEEQSE